MNCIDAGTKYCPCHLTETGDCILCSQLSEKTFCGCINWKGVCIYQEFVWNDSKAKNGREVNDIFNNLVLKSTVSKLVP